MREKEESKGRIGEYHLFLWPQNAEGSPVRMRMTPRTAKAGSTTVSWKERMMSGGEKGRNRREDLQERKDLGWEKELKRR